LVVVAYAQDGKLIAEAKKEGKVVVYGSIDTNIFDDIQKAFEIFDDIQKGIRKENRCDD
jgi:phosphohistidine swiveling domain-containing protein